MISLPLRKDLPSLGDLTIDVRAKWEEDTNLIADIELKCNEERVRLIKEGIRDEMKLHQPTYTLDLEVGMKIQCAFRYIDENKEDEIIEWCMGEVTKVSNRTNLRNLGNRLKYYRKNAAVEVQWDTDASNNEDVIYLIVEIKKTLFNCYNEFGWHLFFDIP